MKRFLALGAIIWALAATGVSAAVISKFTATNNDGIYRLSQGQADYFGASSADRLGFFRVRTSGKTSFTAGDTFDATAILNSLYSGTILGVLNGTHSGLTYTGGAFAPLGQTIIGTLTSYERAVAVLFSSAQSSLAFIGSTTFVASADDAFLDFPVPQPDVVTPEDEESPDISAVPGPATLPLLFTAFGGLAFWRRRGLRAA